MRQPIRITFRCPWCKQLFQVTAAIAKQRLRWTPRLHCSSRCAARRQHHERMKKQYRIQHDLQVYEGINDAMSTFEKQIVTACQIPRQLLDKQRGQQ